MPSRQIKLLESAFCKSAKGLVFEPVHWTFQLFVESMAMKHETQREKMKAYLNC